MGLAIPDGAALLRKLGVDLPVDEIVQVVDTVVVPAIGSAYGPETQFVTVSMNLSYLGAVKEADVVAEGWVTRRGRTTVFCRAEATAGDRLVMEGSLVYAVRSPADAPR